MVRGEERRWDGENINQDPTNKNTSMRVCEVQAKRTECSDRKNCLEGLAQDGKGGMEQGQGAGAVLVKSVALCAVGRQWSFIWEFILHILCGGMCWVPVYIGHSSLLHGKGNLAVETVSRHINR